MTAVGVTPPSASTLHALVAEQAVLAPGGIAVRAADREVTYAELREAATALAGALQRRGVAAGCAVGVCLDRTVDAVVALLGVLTSGAAYVPLDPAHPSERLRAIVDDTDVRCIVTTVGHDHLFADGVERLYMDRVGMWQDASLDAAAAAVSSDDLAYVIYTSGSTGRPKGVEVTHGNVIAFLQGMEPLLGDARSGTVLCSTRLSFDPSGLEIWGPLTAGGTCLMAPDSRLVSIRTVLALIAEEAPSIVQATPLMWELLLDRGVVTHDGQRLLCGGERLPPSLAGRLARIPGRAYNVYGPTEATVWCTYWPIGGSGRPSIGRPLDHITCHVVGDDLAPVPPGERGELCLGGPSVARGYRGDDRLTRERFVPDPWSERPGARLYRTGDVVSVDDRGELDFHGRSDRQVKFHGQRLELGEVEALASEVEGVVDAVALVLPPAGPRSELVLFVRSATPADVLVPAVEPALRSMLPPGVVPGEIVVRPSFPLTANGKVDRAALQALRTRPPVHG